ncbi:hypothetical protein [Rubritalea tangerina]|uniref:hypothetical protein n=1 Tax=Rubritalea tangerina TaxID=430798 RepID=UPI0036142418
MTAPTTCCPTTIGLIETYDNGVSPLSILSTPPVILAMATIARSLARFSKA